MKPKDKITTTLAAIRAQSPCESGWKKLLTSLGGLKAYGENTPLSFKQIYDSNGIDDTLWCLRATDTKWHYLWRHFAVDVAQAVEHLNTDPRVAACNEVCRRYADGQATEAERDAARAAGAAAGAARAAGAAARAAWAAWAAARAAWAAWAAGAARDAAGAAWAAGAAARAAWAAWAAWAARAARDAAGAAGAAQAALLFEYCRLGKRPKGSEIFIKRRLLVNEKEGEK